MNGRPPLALVGPTASGKTEASLEVAEALGAEIVCVDSMVVYRGMDVGTAKPDPEQRRRVRHHGLDLADPAEPFSVALFQGVARRAVAEIAGRGRRSLLVGGSGLYFRAVADGLEFPGTRAQTRRRLTAEAAVVGGPALHRRLAGFDPVAAGRIEPGNVRRTVRALEVAAITGRRFSSFATGWETFAPGAVIAAGVDVPRPILGRRIEDRVHRMVPGLLEEVHGLMARGFEGFLTSTQAIGYSEAVEHLCGRISLDEAVTRTVVRTRALARRQMSWFRRDPRIRWVRAGADGAAGVADEILAYLRDGRPEGPALRTAG